MKIGSAIMSIAVGLVLVAPLGAGTIHQKGQVQANGMTIAYESFGKPDRETILLIAGTGMQLNTSEMLDLTRRQRAQGHVGHLLKWRQC
jgi:hypothetical protein